MGSRINRTKIPTKDNEYTKFKNKTLESLEDKIVFSFKHLYFNSKFTISECGINYFDQLIRIFQDLGDMYMKTFKERYNRVLRNHRINWNREEVTENGFGLPLDDDDGVLNESWQFSISRNKHGRVHGFIIDNIFYIVWLDPEHNLDIGKNGEVTEIKESPRAKLLEELFSGEDREIYLQNTNVIDKMVLAYEEECNNCDLELERLWYNCVICNESDEDNLLKWNGVNVCYDCLKEMKNLDIEESA